VDADVAGLSAQRDEGRRHGQHVQGRQGAGGPQVRLTADGDVSLDARPARAVSDAAVEKPRVSTAETPATPPAKASVAPAAKPTPSAEATPKTPENPDGAR
jgi:hypothetical protein